MWYKNENGDLTLPADIDMVSSKVFNYVRKDFTEVAATEDAPAHYEWMELAVRKENWGTYVQTMTNQANIDYIAMMSDIDIPTTEEA